jgi:hypothetical protein
MDYTVRPERNGVPGEFNLNLLEQLYGTPDRPLTSIPGQPTQLPGEDSNAGGGSTWGDFPTNNFPSGGDEKTEEEEENEGDYRRRDLSSSSTLDDADVVAFEKKVSLDCKEEYCVYPYKNQYYVKINQFMAPSYHNMPK